MLVLFLLLAGGCLSRPTWEEEGEPTPPPGPPEILSEGEVGEQWDQEDYEEELARLDNQLASLQGLEITAVVSRAPFEEWEEGGNRTWEDVGERNIGNDPVLVDSTSLLLLSWWQVRHLLHRLISIPIHIQLLPAPCISDTYRHCSSVLNRAC